MCGIIGYVGSRLTVPVLLDGLKAQEYRGYDSAGIAVLEEDFIRLIRTQGKISVLEEKIGGEVGTATIGIGHTRWATHGRPSDRNSHPHLDCKGEMAVVHNGIIENYLELREWLTAHGHVLASETDTEVLPHLMEHYYHGDLLDAMMDTVKRLEGSYSTVVMCKYEPRRLVAARQDSPLVVGIGEGEYFLASDMAALIQYTRNIIVLQNGDIVLVDGDKGVQVYHNGQPVEREVLYIDWDKDAAQKGGYEHFMLKEIHEQPWALGQTLKGRISADERSIDLKELTFSPEYLKSINKIVIVACGTAYHAGLVGKKAMESLLRIPVEVDIASEFQYRDPIIDHNTLAIIVSQSGETMDSLLALRECRKHGARIVAICNVLDSSISREADCVLYTWAGPEIAVASTKAYITQLMVLYMLTFYLAEQLERKSGDELQPLIAQLYRLPEKVEQLIADCEGKMAEIARFISQYNDVFFIGRGYDYCVAMEGALKLKEISYIHAEAYAAGELKHGTIALIEPGAHTPVIALATQPDVLPRMINGIVEVAARDAHVVGLSMAQHSEVATVCADTVLLPDIDPMLAPILTVVPLQLLAYYAACERGCDVDQPRCLAKSVTVS